jgi:hypothetical protein
MPQRAKTAIPAIERPHTYSFDGMATGIGTARVYFLNYTSCKSHEELWQIITDYS